jgi:23S rRNA (guanosine2251-2'-O)-methyltransferase
MPGKQIVLVVHNLRSAHNVGSLLRTADGLGIDTVYLTGYTPYPSSAYDERLPHIRDKVSKRIGKTSLGAEDYIIWKYEKDVYELIDALVKKGFTIAALEQTNESKALHKVVIPDKVAVIVGSEVSGIEKSLLGVCNMHIQIPMQGDKESFNVSVAAAMALYFIKLKNDGHI